VKGKLLNSPDELRILREGLKYHTGAAILQSYLTPGFWAATSDHKSRLSQQL
jgi:hypothetical protein